ncbi:hypothetical protein QJS10_CPB20g01502 [Acorus calamus]|uniref:CWF21 domain-containing protein n=1 Tax=Acorus calamus TaxID=4465 RepID=A0AAV9CAE0_ACOCL|nr:hypothetical protein QJS10_CPB20g01502 [Acorus calamus]
MEVFKELEAGQGTGGVSSKPNKEILEHDRKRKIQLKLLLLEETLLDQGFTDSEVAERLSEAKRSLEVEADAADVSAVARTNPTKEKMMKGGRKRYDSEDSDTDSTGYAGKTKKHQRHSSDDSSDSDMQLQNKKSNGKQRSRRGQNSDSSENEYDAHVGRKNVDKVGRSKKNMVRHDSYEEDSDIKNSLKRRSGRHAKSKMLTDPSDGSSSSSDISDDSSSEAQSVSGIDYRREPLSRRKVGEDRREKESYMEAGKKPHGSALELGHAQKTGERADARKERAGDQFCDDSRGRETSDGMRRTCAFESKQDMKDTDYGEGMRSKRKLDDDDCHDIQEKRSRKLNVTEGERGRIGEDQVERDSDRRDYRSRGDRKREEGQAEIERGRTGDYPVDVGISAGGTITGVQARSAWRREEYDGVEEIRNKDRYNIEERDSRGQFKEADRDDGVKRRRYDELRARADRGYNDRKDGDRHRRE